MAWASILVALLKVIEIVGSYVANKRLMDAAQSQLVADALKRANDALLAGNSVDLSADRLRDNDGFKRD